MNQNNKENKLEVEFEIEDLSIDDAEVELTIKTDNLKKEVITDSISSDSNNLENKTEASDGSSLASNSTSGNIPTEELLEDSNNDTFSKSENQMPKDATDSEENPSDTFEETSDQEKNNEEEKETSYNDESSIKNVTKNDDRSPNSKKDDFNENKKEPNQNNNNSNENSNDSKTNQNNNSNNEQYDKQRNSEGNPNQTSNILQKKRDDLKNNQERRPRNIKSGKQGSNLKDRLKSGAKNHAKNVANKAKEGAKESFKNSDLGQSIDKAKNAIDKSKKIAQGAKKAGKVVAKSSKAIGVVIKVAIGAWPVTLSILAVIIIVACLSAFLPGSMGNISEGTESFSKEDQKTLEKMKKIFDDYPNADGTLLMATINYPYFNFLWSYEVSEKVSQEYKDEFEEEDTEEYEEGDDTEEILKEDYIGDDLYLEVFKKASYRKKLKKLAKKLSGEGEEAYFEYLKTSYFKSDKAYKSMFEGVSNIDELKNLVINDLKKTKDLFKNYVYSSYSCSSNLQAAGTIEIDEMLKGNILIDVKAPSCTSGKNVWSCESIYSAPITLEKYAKGGAYEEFNSMDVDKTAAQMVAIKSFVISRSKNMGWEIKKDSNGNYVIPIRNNTNDLVYCDIDLGCSSGNTEVGDGNAKRTPISAAQRNVYDQAWEKAKETYIYDKANSKTVGAFCQSRSGSCDFCKKGSCLSHNELANYINTSYDTILTDQYSSMQLIKIEGEYATAMVSGGTDCMPGSAEVDDSNFIYYAQNDYEDIGFCGRSIVGGISWCNGKDNSICSSGCGMTSMTMVIATLTQNISVTPLTINNEVRPGIDCGAGIFGTSGGNMFPYLAQKYGLTSSIIQNTKDNIKVALDGGALIITSVCGSLKSNGRYYNGSCGGHFIVVRGYNDNNVIISDPFQNSSLKSSSGCLLKRSDGGCIKFSMNFDTFIDDLQKKGATTYKIMGPTPFYNLGNQNNNIESK